MIENVFTFRGVNGPMACSSAKALVLAHVTRVKKGIVAPLKFPISVFLWAYLPTFDHQGYFSAPFSNHNLQIL